MDILSVAVNHDTNSHYNDVKQPIEQYQYNRSGKTQSRPSYLALSSHCSCHWPIVVLETSHAH